MADIFLSYSHQDQALAKAIADGLKVAGFDVWYDISLRNGVQFRERIEQELEGADSALVLWSRSSKSSLWVDAESKKAYELGKLLQACLDTNDPPLPFNALQFAKIPEAAKSADWEKLLAALRDRAAQRAQEKTQASPASAVASAQPALDVRDFAKARVAGAVGLRGWLIAIAGLAMAGASGMMIWAVTQPVEANVSLMPALIALVGAAAVSALVAMMTFGRQLTIDRAGG